MPRGADHTTMVLPKEPPTQRMRAHIHQLLRRIGFNQGCLWGTTRLSPCNSLLGPWVKVPVPPNTFLCIRCRRPLATSPIPLTLSVSSVSGAQDLWLQPGLRLRVPPAYETHRGDRTRKLGGSLWLKTTGLVVRSSRHQAAQLRVLLSLIRCVVALLTYHFTTVAFPAAPQEFNLSGQCNLPPQMPDPLPFFPNTGRRRALIVCLRQTEDLTLILIGTEDRDQLFFAYKARLCVKEVHRGRLWHGQLPSRYRFASSIVIIL